jgi:heme exporter protein A
MSTPALVVHDLHVFRGERHVLRGVSFELAAGCCAEVTGPNGSGKTTLLRTLCGIVQSERGTVQWGGRAFDGLRPTATPILAYLGHEPALKGDLTARENLRFAVGLVRRVDEAELSSGLGRTGAGAFADRPVRTLSAGQRRRVALAALRLKRAPLWLLDEPTTNLDAEGQQLIGGLLAEHLDGGGVAVASVHQALRLDGSRTVPIALVGAQP